MVWRRGGVLAAPAVALAAVVAAVPAGTCLIRKAGGHGEALARWARMVKFAQACSTNAAPVVVVVPVAPVVVVAVMARACCRHKGEQQEDGGGAAHPRQRRQRRRRGGGAGCSEGEGRAASASAPGSTLGAQGRAKARLSRAGSAAAGGACRAQWPAAGGAGSPWQQDPPPPTHPPNPARLTGSSLAGLLLPGRSWRAGRSLNAGTNWGRNGRAGRGGG